MNIYHAPNFTYKAISAYKYRTDNRTKRAIQRPSHNNQSFNHNIHYNTCTNSCNTVTTNIKRTALSCMHRNTLQYIIKKTGLIVRQFTPCILPHNIHICIYVPLPKLKR